MSFYTSHGVKRCSLYSFWQLLPFQFLVHFLCSLQQLNLLYTESAVNAIGGDCDVICLPNNFYFSLMHFTINTLRKERAQEKYNPLFMTLEPLNRREFCCRWRTEVYSSSEVCATKMRI